MRAPDKMQALAMLRERGIPIASVIDVGVQRDTAELRKTFPDLHHVLFEPVAEFHADIEKNYADIPHTLVGAAVSDLEGASSLAVTSVFPGVAISHSSIEEDSSGSADRRPIEVTTLDRYLARAPVPIPYFLKIDIDGLELNVLRGATETLKNTSVVMVELPKRRFSERLRFLEDRGFEIFDLVETCYYDGSFWQCDGLMIRTDLQRKHFAQLQDKFVPKKYSRFHLGVDIKPSAG